MPKTSENPALEWAAVLADEMARAGMTDVVIAPGSRSTPLTLAFAAQSRIRVHSLIDERGSAFFALGIALESGRPAAVLCTSGTAAANFYPAVIEASQSHVPLVVLTADRPAEVRGTGANQTIDQVGMYGAYVRYAQDFLPPQPGDAGLMRYLRTSVDRALTAALAPVPGPVHLNIPFRKPLEPARDESMPDGTAGGRADGKPFTQIGLGPPEVRLPEIDWPARGLILAGPRCPEGDFPHALAELSAASGYPVIADSLSGLRFGPWNSRIKVYNPEVCKAFLQDSLPMPDIVLQFGTVPVSNPAMNLLAQLPQQTLRVSVQPHGTWHDDTHGLTHLVHADPAAFCRSLQVKFVASGEDVWAGALSALDSGYWDSVDDAARTGYFEGLVLQDVLRSMPEDGLLFVANSLAVRHLDEWTRVAEKRVRVFCNRGASGIDGTISTGLGVASSAGRAIVIVLGDLAFYHDLNGLLALKRCGIPATIVLVNNDGGGIFRRLPVAAVEPPFTEMFLTPHGLDFSPAAEMFGAGFTRVSDQEGLIDALGRAVGTPEAHVIEFTADSAQHEAKRLQVAAAWSEKIKQITGALPGKKK